MNRRTLLLLLLMLVGMVVLPAASASAASEVRLSLADCLRMALENNLDLVAARMDPEIALNQVDQQAAAFDPTLNSTGFSFGFETEPSDEFVSAGGGHSHGIREQLIKPFEFGGDIDAQLTTTRRKGAGSNFFIPSQADVFVTDEGEFVPGGGLDDPFYETTLQVTFNMPLLRGRGKEATTEQLLLARGNLDMSEAELERRAELTIESVEGAYWDLVAAGQGLSVAGKRLERADDLLDLNKKKVDVGTLAPIEITQAKAGVASQEEGVILAEETLENAEDELLRLLSIPWDDPLWESVIVPSDAPVFEQVSIDLADAIEEALSNRPDLSSAEQDLRNKELSERAARNGVKHGLDFSLTVTPEGNNFLIDNLDSTAPIPPSDNRRMARGDVGDTYSELFDGEFFTWSSNLVYSVPIGNKAAKAGYRIATLNREKAEISLRSLKLTTKVEVRAAVRSVDSGGKRVSAAGENVRLQREKLDAEQKKYDNGMSTSFEVLTFQEDLADAELSEIRAVLDYNKALAAFERSKGTLLEARGLSMAP